jgi:hypothetical protein
MQADLFPIWLALFVGLGTLAIFSRGGCRAPSDHARPQGRIVVTLPCSTLACRSPVRAVNATVTCSTRSRCHVIAAVSEITFGPHAMRPTAP